MLLQYEQIENDILRLLILQKVQYNTLSIKWGGRICAGFGKFWKVTEINLLEFTLEVLLHYI